MKFLSTRGQTPALGFSDAVATGLAPDGGLFLPESLPDFSGDLARFEKLSYAELCFEFMRVFATDIPAMPSWGTPYLYGPGSIHVAHRDDEHVEVAELRRAVDTYERIVRQLSSR